MNAVNSCCILGPQKSSKQEMEGEMDRQKRNFQRQLTDSRAHSHSVTQMRSENLALQEKLAEQAAVNDKLKATNQVCTSQCVLQCGS